jgi:hypothetical protein
MPIDNPEPNIHDLQKMVQDLCGHLRDIQGAVDDPQMRTELAQYMRTLEEANKDLVAEYAQAEKEYEAALEMTKQEEEQRRQEALREKPSKPPAPAEEDVLPLGLSLRAQILERYGILKSGQDS